jgi:hypothetical protein
LDLLSAGDELAEVIRKFDRMRTGLQHTQQELLRTERLINERQNPLP